MCIIYKQIPKKSETLQAHILKAKLFVGFYKKVRES